MDNTNKIINILQNIQQAAAIILWVVLTQALLWPIGWGVSTYRDMPIISTGVLTWSVAFAAIIAFGVMRWVFPIQYPPEMTGDQNE